EAGVDGASRVRGVERLGDVHPHAGRDVDGDPADRRGVADGPQGRASAKRSGDVNGISAAPFDRPIDALVTDRGDARDGSLETLHRRLARLEVGVEDPQANVTPVVVHGVKGRKHPEAGELAYDG